MDNFDKYFAKNHDYVIDNYFYKWTDNIELIITIPVFSDFDIFDTILDFINKNHGTEHRYGIIVIVNYSETADKATKVENNNLYCKLQEFSKDLKANIIVKSAFNLNAKQAGVGLARKIAMDMSAFYFHSVDKKDAIIASLDADTHVEKDYVSKILAFFKKQTLCRSKYRFCTQA